MNKIRILLVSMVTLVAVGGGCNEKQIKKVDVIVGDVNDIVAGVEAALESPAGDLLPPDYRLYAAAGVALASIAINSWQKVRSTLMTKTTKAIVKGIEANEKQKKPNPTNHVKEAIRCQMIDAGIYDRGNRLVDRMKIAR